MQEVIRFAEALAIWFIAAPLIGSAIMQKAFAKIAVTDVSFGQFFQVYLGACFCAYLASAVANMLVPANVIVQWIAIVGMQLAYIPPLLAWITKKPITKPMLRMEALAIVLTNLIVSVIIYVFLSQS